MNFNRNFSDVFHTLRSLIVGCGRHPRCFDWYDFGQSTWQVLFTNVKIMLRRYILSLGSREIVKCQKRLMSLDAVAPIGTAIEKDANYKVKKTRAFRISSTSFGADTAESTVACLNWLCNKTDTSDGLKLWIIWSNLRRQWIICRATFQYIHQNWFWSFQVTLYSEFVFMIL